MMCRHYLLQNIPYAIENSETDETHSITYMYHINLLSMLCEHGSFHIRTVSIIYFHIF